jgi:hypothetical protein
LLETLRPQLAITLHETVDEPQDAYFVGEGLLLIEEFPLSYSELRAIRGLGIFTPLARWAASTLRLPPYWQAAMALRGNPACSLFSEAAKRYVKQGGRLLNDIYLEFLRGFTALGRGRVTHSRGVIDDPWLTFTGYCLAHFGAPGVTLETFNTSYIGLRGIETRAARLASYTAGLLDILNARG